MLKFDNVTKEFKDGNQIIEAVKATSLQFNKGEIIAIIGPSGSGKSTLLTMAGALQKPTEGTITVGDKEVNTLKQKQLSKLRMDKIGFILQASNLVDFLTVKQQLQLLQKNKKNVMSNDERDALIKQLGLEKIQNQLPSQISGGQRQRVAIAKALYTNPAIILADEPTASLDTENAVEVMEILREQTKNRNKTSVIVTHDERLTKYCDRVFEMIDGELQEKTQTQ